MSEVQKRDPVGIFRKALRAAVGRKTALHPIADIGGCRITNLHPLKASAFAKSGNISLSGMHKGRRVKLSSMFTCKQVALRRKLNQISEHIALPRLIASDDRFIVEEWIDGTSPGRLQDAARERVKASIRDFVFGAARLRYGADDQTGFDYLDYLEQRVAGWHFIHGVREFVNRWREARATLHQEFRLALSNPDLSFQNFVIQQKTGQIFLIDNEFLHVGNGGFMDFFNSAIRAERPSFDVSPEMCVFFRNTVKLRWLGSALIEGKPERISPSMLEWEFV